MFLWDLSCSTAFALQLSGRHKPVPQNKIRHIYIFIFTFIFLYNLIFFYWHLHDAPYVSCPLRSCFSVWLCKQTFQKMFFLEILRWLITWTDCQSWMMSMESFVNLTFNSDPYVLLDVGKHLFLHSLNSYPWNLFNFLYSQKMWLVPRKSPQRAIPHQFLMEKMPCPFSVLLLRLVS